MVSLKLEKKTHPHWALKDWLSHLNYYSHVLHFFNSVSGLQTTSILPPTVSEFLDAALVKENDQLYSSSYSVVKNINFPLSLLPGYILTIPKII